MIICSNTPKKPNFNACLAHLRCTAGLKMQVAESATGTLWTAVQCWVDSVKSITSHDFLTQSSQVTSHAAPVDSVKSRCRAVTVTE